MASDIQLPPTMRAWSYKTRGLLPEVLTLTSDTPMPTTNTNLAPNDVLVKIAYSGLTPSISSLIPIIPNWTHTVPAIPELEFSGTIIALGSNVTRVRPELELETPVFGVISMQLYFKGHGTLATYCPCPAERLSVLPPGVSMRDGAALAGNGVTAVQVLEAVLLKKGDKVLINGGSGGTGTMIVQLARWIVGESGCVVVTCSAGNAGLVEGLGADEVIDYRKHHPLHEYLSKTHSETRFDAIIDTVGIQELYTHSPNYLREGGRFVNIGAMQLQSGLSSILGFMWTQLVNLLWPRYLGGTPRWYKVVSGTPNQSSLSAVKKLSEDGTWSPVIDSEWEMEDALKAYERLRSQRAKGKVLIKIQN